MATSSTPLPRWQVITGRVLSGLLALVFLPSAFFKLAQPGAFLEGWTKSYPAGAARPLGAIELTCLVLYLVPPTRVLGAILLVSYLGGAVATHVHAMDGNWPIPVLVGVIAWAGLYLRDARVRRLVPTVKDEPVSP